MKLLEALTLVKDAATTDGQSFGAFLACGFTPLHLQTFFAGHLQRRSPGRRVQVQTGLFGDVTGSIERLVALAPDAAAVVLEWADLDARLGLRSLGGWRPSDLSSIAQSVQGRLTAILRGLEGAVGRFPLALSLPTLPLPPVAVTVGWQSSAFELELRATVAAFAAQAAALPLVRVVSAQELDCLSPPPKRFDVRAELDAGAPYTMAHAETLADLLSRLVSPELPKKGLITDLDGTLWRGLLGEEGAAGVAWSLDAHAQTHGLYQRVLGSLAEQGVLLAIATKNDRALVDEALKRDDLVVDASRIFPVEAHWSPKSESVERILRAWNIGQDSVVFVDDSPMELAEVRAAFPALECVQFAGDDAEATHRLLARLRALFGRESTGAEDALRLSTLRSAEHARTDRLESASPEAFLETVEAELELSFHKLPVDPRALELTNKTNQFNLNGRREGESAWRARLDDPETFLLVASYRDKYGPLGKVAVIRGRGLASSTLEIDTWVMSCRAFARRIEHRCLEQLFTRFSATEIVFDYAPTERNSVLAELFASLLGTAPGPAQRLSRELFAQRCPPLYHAVSERT